MEEKKNVNLSDLDANFVISSFKNKERRNNPSSIPRPLIPENERKHPKQAEIDKRKAETANAASISNESDKVDMDNAGSKSDNPDSGDVSDTVNTSDSGIIINEAVGTSNAFKRTTSRNRKAAFEEYQKQFLITPKIKHRKPVFISEGIRDRLDEVAMRLGKKGMSASGLIENMVIHHLKTYEEDIEFWRKL